MKTNKRILCVAIVLFSTVALRGWVSTSAKAPARLSLEKFPTRIGDWQMVSDIPLRDDVAGVLKADDYLDRGYRADGRTINLFIAYYATQRAGESMHSPKNCLPGSGWVSVVNDTVVLRNDGDGGPQKVNRYLIEKNGERALVIYWYQAGGRVIASEYAGKVFLVWDALRTGRRDAALVRLIVPLRKAEDPTKPLDALLSFAQASRSQLPKFLPD